MRPVNNVQRISDIFARDQAFITATSVCDGLPPVFTMVIFWRLRDDRAMLPVISATSQFGTPHTNAIYLRVKLCSENVFTNSRNAASDLAKTMTPLVSLSNLCTTPGRVAPPSADRFVCAKMFCTNVPVLLPADGYITTPRGLLITIISSSSNKISNSKSDETLSVATSVFGTGISTINASPTRIFSENFGAVPSARRTVKR